MESHLLQMRGLKHFSHLIFIHRFASHLLQMRGLKLNNRRFDLECEESHLLQMRGLKLDNQAIPHSLRYVASFTDAWIETKIEKPGEQPDTSRIFYRCVD